MKRLIFFILLLAFILPIKAQYFESVLSLPISGKDNFIDTNGELLTLASFRDSIIIQQLQKTLYSSNNRSILLKQRANGQLYYADTLFTNSYNKWYRSGNYSYLYGNKLVKCDNSMNLIWEKDIPIHILCI